MGRPHHQVLQALGEQGVKEGSGVADGPALDDGASDHEAVAPAHGVGYLWQQPSIQNRLSGDSCTML